MERPRDTRANEQTEAAAWRVLTEVLIPRFHKLLPEDPHDYLAVPAGSVLAHDDEATSYNPVSYQCRALIASASDHLETVERAMKGAGGIPPFALYTLVRSAIEASASVVWLTSGGTRDKRVHRSLKLTQQNAADLEPLLRSLGKFDAAKYAHRDKRLAAIAGARKTLAGRSLEMESTSLILRDTDKFLGSRAGLSGLDAWRACSGIAHANSSAAIGLLEMEPVEGTHDATGSSYRMTSSITLLTMVYLVGFEYLEASVSAYQRLYKEEPGAKHRAASGSAAFPAE